MNSYTISPSDDSFISIEVSRTGLRRRKKHFLSFNKFKGEMCFSENDPGVFKMSLIIDAGSAAGELACKKALEANVHPDIRFTSDSIRAGVLRGFVIRGILQIRDTPCVVSFSTTLNRGRNSRLQIDGDATLRLGDFGLPRPSALFGLIGTKDEALVRVLLWATLR
jgi:polyisoprenoid-binding protein YceI